jgi:hypothetical protein
MVYCVMFRFYFLHAMKSQCNEWLLVIYFLCHEKIIVMNDCLDIIFLVCHGINDELC